MQVLNDEEEGEPPIWFDWSGCKNNCKGDDDDDDDDDRFSASITIKGRTKSTKSVRKQMSMIVPVKGRPVGAPQHVIEEMFSFEDVSVVCLSCSVWGYPICFYIFKNSDTDFYFFIFFFFFFF